MVSVTQGNFTLLKKQPSRPFPTHLNFFYTTVLLIPGFATGNYPSQRKKPSASGISRTGANMETSNSSRDTILKSIRSNLPKVAVEHPEIRAFQPPAGDLKAMLEQRLKEAGEAAHD